jgi:predicted MFS family arabinose efflux permease
VPGPVIAARSLGGASAWGFISAAWGVGAIAGGLVALRVKPRRPLVVATLLTTLIALPPLALAFSDSVALIAAALVVFAFEVVWSNSMFSSTIQALIPDQVRSRVDSYDMLISIVIMPVGCRATGPCTERRQDRSSARTGRSSARSLPGPTARSIPLVPTSGSLP